MSQVQSNPTPAAAPKPAPAAEPVAAAPPASQPAEAQAAPSAEAALPAPVQHQPLGKTSASKASIMTCRDTANLLALACRKSYAETDWAKVARLAQVILTEALKESVPAASAGAGNKETASS